MTVSCTSQRADVVPGRPDVGCSPAEADEITVSTSLIIDARDRLPWHHRFAWEASTAALWGGWLWLWAPLLKVGGPLARLSLQLPPWLASVSSASDGLPLSLAALAGTSGTLVMLGKLPSRKPGKVEPLPVSEYARHFELAEQVIEEGRRATTCVVHHDADGRIARIECRGGVSRAA
jgi:poly-beta-1,6-N-acetyl-D-glucosamine biosynthesis protein PgaD